MDYRMSEKEAASLIREKLSHHFGVQPQEASYEDFYKAVAMIVNDRMHEGRSEFMEKAEAQNTKQVYYLCMEFLMGRSLRNNLYNLGLEKTFEKALSRFDIKLDRVYEQEPDAGLGNGGLGRLAACFLDGLATCGYPAMGYSILYEYGIFKQKIVDGWQTELPEFWLPGGEIWLTPHPEQSVEVRFDGEVSERWDGSFHHVELVNYSPVHAVPYDMMVSGKDGKGISVLRLWKATYPGFDMSLFNRGDYSKAIEQNAMAEVISKVLYPADDHPEGKSLRLRQQYFLVSASIQDIVRRHLASNGSLDNLPETIAIHINDTHPALAIPELMRILLDECGYTWDDAWGIVSRTVAYTNDTVMREALECWTSDLFKARLPRIYQIVLEISNRFRREVWEKTGDAGLVERTAIVSNGLVKMANLSVAGGHSVNGVSRLHSEILKETVFKDFYTLMPQKFQNVTNGIAFRRWLCQANPELTALISSLIGDGFILNASELENLLKYKNDASVLKQLETIKLHNKERLAKYIQKENGITLDPSSIFDIQVKRMHEYKRQHLNALHILAEYQFLKENPNADYTPHTYIFGAKAAPGYFLAKKIINFIVQLSKMIEADPAVRDKLRVVYVEDYRVTLAELLMPAAEISEQISLAGTEASGTGNMKFMLNGAVTLGTLDGANVEIHEAVGDENIVIFGMKTEEAAKLQQQGYHPQTYYNHNPRLKRAVDQMSEGILGVPFADIAGSILHSDPYMVMADFEDYCAAHQKLVELYRDRTRFNQMSLANIAGAGRFSADRAIRDYAGSIWHTEPVDFSK